MGDLEKSRSELRELHEQLNQVAPRSNGRHAHGNAGNNHQADTAVVRDVDPRKFGINARRKADEDDKPLSKRLRSRLGPAHDHDDAPEHSSGRTDDLRSRIGTDDHSRVSLSSTSGRGASPPRQAHAGHRGQSSRTPSSSSNANTVPVDLPPARPRPAPAPVDDTGKKRNARMFGFLQATLTDFRETTSKEKEKEQKREEIVSKVEERVQSRLDEDAEKRRVLLEQLRAKKEEVQRIEKKQQLESLKSHWESHRAQLANFIRLSSSPAIYFSPKSHNDYTTKWLERSRAEQQAENQTRSDALSAEIQAFSEPAPANQVHEEESAAHEADGSTSKTDDE